ncbi:hypothetical protein Tco_1144683 [Tanacetum coccineum]
MVDALTTMRGNEGVYFALDEVLLLLYRLSYIVYYFHVPILLEECAIDLLSVGDSKLLLERSSTDLSFGVIFGFSRYSELCGRNVLAKRSLDVPPAAISSNFGTVEQLDLEVFEKYSDMCGKNIVTRFSTPSVNVVRTSNVINSQTIFSEPLRLNVSEEVSPSHDRAHLNVAAEEL